MRTSRTIWLFVIRVTSVPLLVYAGYKVFDQRFSTLPVLGKSERKNGITIYHTVNDFSFTDQNGEQSGSAQWNDRIVVVNFFFTTCPVICPKMTRNLIRVQNAVDKNSVLINSISVDPGKDSAERLKWYESRFDIRGANWKLLTGDKKAIYRLARNSFMVVATDGDGGPEDFIHSEKLILIDRLKRIRGYYDGTSETDANKLIADIKKLQHEK